MRANVRLNWAMVGLVFIAAGCSAPNATEHQEGALAEDGAGTDSLPEGEDDPEGTSLDVQFATAAATYAVPETLLKSIAWVETRWHMALGEEEFEGHGRRYGIMALRDDVIDEAAALADLSVEHVKTDAAANIAAAAALLSARADETNLARDDVGAWAEVTAQYSAIETEVARSAYVHEEVYGTLKERYLFEACGNIEIKGKGAMSTYFLTGSR
jgi:hypothetical protein